MGSVRSHIQRLSVVVPSVKFMRTTIRFSGWVLILGACTFVWTSTCLERPADSMVLLQTRGKGEEFEVLQVDFHLPEGRLTTRIIVVCQL